MRRTKGLARTLLGQRQFDVQLAWRVNRPSVAGAFATFRDSATLCIANSMKLLRSLCLSFAVLLSGLGMVVEVHGAAVGSNGYTNDFSTQPAASDWATFSIAGAAADVTSPGQVDTEVQAIAASAITTPT